MLLELEDDALVEVLRASKDAGVLLALTSASRKLCRLARSRLPVRLRPQDQQQASVITNATKRGMPFSGCTELHLTVTDLSSWETAMSILSAAQQWAALQRLRLCVFPARPQWYEQSISEMEAVLCGLFQHLPALQQLQFLDLDVPYLHTSSAAALQLVTQVTSFKLLTRGTLEPPADISFLAFWPNLVTLHLKGWQQVAPPAAEQQASLPGSLVSLHLTDEIGIRGMVDSWVPHLAGCPQLQHLEVRWGNRLQANTHPTALLQQLAAHHKQLRSLTTSYGPTTREWQLPMGDNPWRPDASLAAVTGLQRLSAGDLLHFKDHGDWQHAAQLTALTSLTGARFYCAPDPLLAGEVLTTLELGACWVCVEDGYELGRILLACPLLERADLDIGWKLGSTHALPAAGTAGSATTAPAPAAAAETGRPPLPAHPTLQELALGPCFHWGPAAAAAAHFGLLSPVLTGVTQLTLKAWPGGGAPSPFGPAPQAAGPLPDLSPCSSLVSLVFGDAGGISQGMFCAMVAPLQQLQRIMLIGARQATASVGVELQGILPRLQRLQLKGCGKYELSRVQDQLRQGFELVVE
jgi:hypothetical protein